MPLCLPNFPHIVFMGDWWSGFEAVHWIDPKSLLLILKHAIEIGYNNELIKVARPSIFVHARTPSISKSLILKQIDLYCKNSITNVLYIDSTLLWYYFWAIGINITWQWRHNKSNFCPYGNFLLKCFTLPFLWVLVFCCAKFHKNL